MAKERSESGSFRLPERASVDWKYALFYLFFYGWLLLIALFGVFSEV